VTAIAILVVDVPPRGLLRSQPELRIASAPLDFTATTQYEQKESTASQCAFQRQDIKKSELRKINVGRLDHVGDQFSYTACAPAPCSQHYWRGLCPIFTSEIQLL